MSPSSSALSSSVVCAFFVTDWHTILHAFLFLCRDVTSCGSACTLPYLSRWPRHCWTPTWTFWREGAVPTSRVSSSFSSSFSPCFSPCLFLRVSYAVFLVLALFGTHTTWHRFCVLRLPVPKCPHQCHRGESGRGVRRITSAVS